VTAAEAVAPVVQVETQALAESATQYLEPELAIAGEGADWEVVVALQLLTQALAEQSDGDGSIGSGVADDGSTVAVGTPPVPPSRGCRCGRRRFDGCRGDPAGAAGRGSRCGRRRFDRGRGNPTDRSLIDRAAQRRRCTDEKSSGKTLATLAVRYSP
jgi:hypothetical protein